MAELGEESTTVSANRGSFAAICFTLRPDSHPRPIFGLLSMLVSFFPSQSLRSFVNYISLFSFISIQTLRLIFTVIRRNKSLASDF